MPDESKSERQIKNARAKLGEASARLTPQREAVLKALIEHPSGHQSAEEVLHAARDWRPDLGIATVYRALELFSRLGITRRLDTTEGQSRFEYNANADEHYHHHVICLQCGKIAEFHEDRLGDIERRASKRTGYEVVDHCLQIYGYCPECSAEKKQNN